MASLIAVVPNLYTIVRRLHLSLSLPLMVGLVASSILTKMRATYVKLFILFMLYSITIEGQQVPCLFIMGDSLFDNGNNNILFTLAKTNYLPYGIDYPLGPTGRFSNGKNVPDFLGPSTYSCHRRLHNLRLLINFM